MLVITIPKTRNDLGISHSQRPIISNTQKKFCHIGHIYLMISIRESSLLIMLDNCDRYPASVLK